MSFYQDLTYISLTGAKANVIRMLNAAIVNVGAGNVIVEGDDITTVNDKVRGVENADGLNVGLHDLLDDTCLQQIIEKKSSWENAHAEEDSDKMISITCVKACGDEYEVECVLYESEACYYEDWVGWDDIARLYGCKIFMDREEYCSGSYQGYRGSRVYYPNGSGVQEFNLCPSIDTFSYAVDFNSLIRLNPQRYRQRKIGFLNDMIERFQLEIKREEALAERDALMSERGIDIDESTWETIVTNENEGPEQLAEWYHWYTSRIVRDDFESQNANQLKTILKLRAEKWQGVNETLAACYAALLADFK